MSDTHADHSHALSAIIRLANWLIGLAVILLGAGLFAYQLLLWLQHGEWTSFDVKSGMQWGLGHSVGPVPDMKWKGVRKLLEWLLEMPLGLGLIGLGFFTILAATTQIVRYILAAVVVVLWVEMFRS